MKYARTSNNQAIDVRTESPDGFFTPDIAAQFQQVPDEVENGWLLDNGNWSAPVIPEPVPAPETVITYVKVSPIEFKLLFTSSERVAIKAARINDPVIDDFYDIVEDPRLTFVDLGLNSTQQALQHMVTQGLIASERVEQILSNQLQ